MQPRDHSIVLWLGLLLLSGCGAGDRPSPAVVRDSAGVAIVQSVAPLWTKGAGWRLSSEPALGIGAYAGDPRYELYRVSGALRLPDGRLVIANAGTSEVRYYDARGRHLASVGRKGNGPGEFQDISRIDRFRADSLLVWDGVHRRASVLAPDGRFARSFRLEHVADGFTFPIAYLADGTILAASTTPMGSRTSTGVQRDTALFVRFDGNGALIDSLGRFPDGERYVRAEANGMIGTIGRPLGRSTMVSAGGEGFYLGTADAYQVAAYSPEGRLERILRIERSNRSVTPADIERYLELRLANIDSRSSANLRRMYEDAPYPSTMPAYQKLLTDAAGHLWVEDYRAPGEEQRRWTIFDPEGRQLGSIAVPDGFDVMQVGSDFVLGVHRDELGVERVRLYGLNRAG